MQIDALCEAIKKTQCPACVGLDTELSHLPQEYRPIETSNTEISQSVFRYNCDIIDAIQDVVPSVKVQAAYYEQYGAEGVRCFLDTMAYAKDKRLVVIADVKRNDIGSTAKAYANAYIRNSAADFITVNAYLGIDGIAPFIEACAETGKGIFVLVKTSNPSGGEFQDLDSRRQESSMRSSRTRRRSGAMAADRTARLQQRRRSRRARRIPRRRRRCGSAARIHIFPRAGLRRAGGGRGRHRGELRQPRPRRGGQLVARHIARVEEGSVRRAWSAPQAARQAVLEYETGYIAARSQSAAVSIFKEKHMAILTLEDGTRFEGLSFGAQARYRGRGRVQHRHDGLSGGADRSVVLRADRNDDLPADRQLRRQRRRTPKARSRRCARSSCARCATRRPTGAAKAASTRI